MVPSHDLPDKTVKTTQVPAVSHWQEGKLLANQQDFQDEKSLIQIIIEQAEHKH